MAAYRILYIEGDHALEKDEIVADSDDEALTLFSLRRETTDCEIWCGDRKVATVAKGGTPVRASR